MSSGNGSLLSFVTVIAVAKTTSAIANIAPCLLARVGDKHRGRTSLMRMEVGDRRLDGGLRVGDRSKW
jgi:hypothetical protein